MPDRLVWRLREPAVTVARAGRRRLAVEDICQIRGHRRIDGLDHRDFDQPPAAAFLPVVKRGENAGVKMNAADEVGDGGPRLDRRTVGKAGHAHDARHRLDGQVHRQIVAIGPRQPIARSRAVDQPRIDGAENGIADAQTIEHARRVVLDQHVGLCRELFQNRHPFRRLQVEADVALVGVEHRERDRVALADAGAMTHRLAVRRLDLDDGRAGLRHQEAGIRTLIHLAEVDDDHAFERQLVGMVQDVLGTVRNCKAASDCRSGSFGGRLRRGRIRARDEADPEDRASSPRCGRHEANRCPTRPDRAEPGRWRA